MTSILNGHWCHNETDCKTLGVYNGGWRTLSGLDKLNRRNLPLISHQLADPLFKVATTTCHQTTGLPGAQESSLHQAK